jgi:Leucine-rich repeat (LRR) protein
MSISIDENPIEQLPESLFNLSNLRSLDVSGTSLINIPFNMSDFTKLEYLNVGDLGLDKEQVESIRKQMISVKRLEIVF